MAYHHTDTGGDRYYGQETLEDGMQVDTRWLEAYTSRVDPRDLYMPNGVDSTGAQEEALGGDAAAIMAIFNASDNEEEEDDNSGENSAESDDEDGGARGAAGGRGWGERTGA